MVSKTRAKGARSVRSITDSLEKQGWVVGIVERNNRFIKEKDLFGLWDLAAYRGREILFIQAKTNLSPYGKKKGEPATWLLPYIQFGREHGSELVKFQVHIKYDFKKEISIVECI